MKNWPYAGNSLERFVPEAVKIKTIGQSAGKTHERTLNDWMPVTQNGLCYSLTYKEIL